MATAQKYLIEPVQQKITDNIEQLMAVLPPEVCRSLKKHADLQDLLEIVMDLGRFPEARFPTEVYTILDRHINQEDLDFVTARVGSFGADNRAGIERTLHRISAIRNRAGKVIGLTCRIGRAVYGTIDIIRDVVETGKSVLMLGRPGVGKTTKLREVARILSEEFNKRVVIVDTSNEIAGDGDVPHPAIGRARRMQVPTPAQQHAVMIEAVENHMPEVIVIDEIGTEAEAFASRTIAERGVQLIGTAHGNSLENLLMNPTLSDLVGGIGAVTLSDEEAKRRGTQKTVLERKAPPTFDVVIEILEVDKLAIHHDVMSTVDRMLRGSAPRPEIRIRRESGEVEVVQREETGRGAYGASFPTRGVEAPAPGGRRINGKTEIPLAIPKEVPPTVRVFPYGVSRNRLEKAIRELRLPMYITKDLGEADAIIALKSHARKDSARLQEALNQNKPTFVVRSNTYAQVSTVLREMFNLPQDQALNDEETALQEAEDAAERVHEFGEPVELRAQSSYVRRLQHELIQRYELTSESIGSEPNRRIRVSK
ncbi:MAG TPA: R3H domain-containing nucleic acid-binding protein [Armatimonadota bacterium]|jgi:stage III sporulation protein SpoIIIAA